MLVPCLSLFLSLLFPHLSRSFSLMYVADLAVDWIHDKLYWSDSGSKRIEEVDLHTNERRIVVQLDSGSNPVGLAVYPTMEHG